MAIGKLEKVELRELWKHEEYGFSAWLAANLDALSEVIGISLSEPEREAKIGTFEVDIVAEDGEGNRVIVENQLEQTNHDHLGKLITYLTNLDAKTAVWITKFARPEHRRAVAWLNEITPNDVSFFLVQLEAFRIGNSDPAPLFTVVEGPSEDVKEIGGNKKELAERHVRRLRFWEMLLARAKSKGVLWHTSRSPSRDMWLSVGAGRTGFNFNYLMWMNDDSAVELYLDTGEAEPNKAIFDTLFAKRAVIDKAFGGELQWMRKDEKRACRIQHTIALGGLTSSEDKWPTIQDAMIDAMDRLVKALKPHIAELP